jgi:hypothetical protein
MSMGRLLIIVGATVLAAGLLISFGGRFFGAGKLPGDIVVRRNNFTFYFPVMTSIVLSVILTLVLWLFSRR